MMRDVNDRASDPDPGDENSQPADGEMLSRLLHVAGPRQSAPRHVVAEIKQATYPAWRAKVGAVALARRRRRAWTLALAAVLLASVGLTLWLSPKLSPASTAPAVRVAKVEAVAGAVAVTGSSPSGGVEVGAALDPGSTLETGLASHATLRLAGGTSARLDVETRLRLDTANRLKLERGAIYLDTGSVVGRAALEVTTPYGVARDIGTQFEVRVLGEGLKIQVREGEVEVDLGEVVHAAAAGTALTVATDGSVARVNVTAHDSAWGWVLQTSPPFELEGRTLGEFLHWVSRETGWQIRFPDPALEREVAGTVLHGSISAVRPDQAPDLVLPGSGLRYRIKNGTLWIEQAAAGQGE